MLTFLVDQTRLIRFGAAVALTLVFAAFAPAQNNFGNPPATQSGYNPLNDPQLQFGAPANQSPQQLQQAQQQLQQQAQQFQQHAGQQLQQVEQVVGQQLQQLQSGMQQTTGNQMPAALDEMPDAGVAEEDPTVGLSLEDATQQAAIELQRRMEEEAKKTQTLIEKAWNGDSDAQWEFFNTYILSVLVIIGVLIAANWLAGKLSNIVTQVVSKHVDVTLGQFAGTLSRYAVMAIAVIVILNKFEISTAGLATIVAALGFAVGMALQGTLGNFASGISLLIFRPFKVGDYIIVDDTEGTVRAIELFTTTIDTLDNRHIIVPNGSVFGNKIENWSYNGQRRVEVTVGASYSADMKQTRRVLLNGISNIEGALVEPQPSVYLEELNASSVDWVCRVWCTPANYLEVKERVTEAAKESLDKNGISIPFPQLDLHVIHPALQKAAA